MNIKIKGIPRETCYYRHDKTNIGIMQAGCNKDWIVLQENFTFCTFCGKPIETNPPPKQRTVA